MDYNVKGRPAAVGFMRTACGAVGSTERFRFYFPGAAANCSKGTGVAKIGRFSRVQVIPQPGTTGLAFAGLAGLLGFRRRRRRRAADPAKRIAFASGGG